MPNTIADVDFFFCNPLVPPCLHRRGGGEHSVLYLVRREIQDCFIGDVIPEVEVVGRAEKHRLFATLMMVFCAIDLLGKFRSGTDDDAIIGVGKRFNSYLEEYLGLDAGQRDAVWSVRNSMMHSFGLYDKKDKVKVAVAHGASVQEKPVQKVSTQVTSDGAVWLVRIEPLYSAFVESVARYEADVRANKDDLRASFMKVFPTYGYIVIG